MDPELKPQLDPAQYIAFESGSMAILALFLDCLWS
jgi:hypothetical protein